MRTVPTSYFLQVLVAFGCLLLPVLLQGSYAFIDSGVAYYFLWTVFLAAVWLRFRWPVWVCMPLLLVSFSYSGYVVSQHEDINFSVVSAIIDTDPAELLSYVRTPGVAKYGCVMVAVIGVLWWLLGGTWLRRRITGNIRLHAAALPVVMIACAAIYLITGSGWDKLRMYPSNIFTYGFRFIREVRIAKLQYAKVNYTYAGPDAAQGPPRLTAVLIVGESARAANWSLYGYGRPTNPEVAAWMEKSNGRGVVFRDALSAGRLTMNSVPSMLSPTTAKNFREYCLKPSLLWVFRAGGFRTAVLSSHISASKFWDGPAHLMMKAAAENKRIERDDLQPAALNAWRTHEAMPRQLVVMHLFGSHYNYADRYPENFKLFHGGNEMVDTYDNSLAFTDHVLGGIIAEIEDMSDPAVMFYSSDHGENLDDFGDGNIEHCCREFTRFEIEVPMIFYANKAFAEAYPRQLAAIRACENQPVSHDNLSQTLLGLAGLTDPQVYLPAYDLSMEPHTPQPRFLINSLRESVAEADIRATPHGRRVTVTARPDHAAKAAGGGNP